MTKCYFCKKEYETYPVIMCSNLECLALEMHWKDIYYSDELDEGVCQKCRDKELHDNVRVWRALLNVQLKLELVKTDLKDKESIKKYDEAIKRTKKWNKRLEQTPEVIAILKKNVPYKFKKPLKEKTPCNYCGENHGQVWINNPNEQEPKIENCWWVCKPCRKLIELQDEHAFLLQTSNKFGHTETSKEKIKQLEKEIGEIAHEDGQDVACFEIRKDGNKITNKRLY